MKITAIESKGLDEVGSLETLVFILTYMLEMVMSSFLVRWHGLRIIVANYERHMRNDELVDFFAYVWREFKEWKPLRK